MLFSVVYMLVSVVYMLFRVVYMLLHIKYILVHIWNTYGNYICLQDAYFSVPIHDSYEHYLRFIFQGTTYEFQCLPFGLSSAPWTFTKLLKPVISLLRSLGIRIVIYLDDMLILDESPDCLASVFRSIVNVLKQLGFLIK